MSAAFFFFFFEARHGNAAAVLLLVYRERRKAESLMLEWKVRLVSQKLSCLSNKMPLDYLYLGIFCFLMLLNSSTLFHPNLLVGFFADICDHYKFSWFLQWLPLA